MPALYHRPTRQGRLSRHVWTARLPTYWIETGSNLPVDLSTGTTWGLPNTYPLMYMDTRRRRSTDARAYEAPVERYTPISGENYAAAILRVVQKYVEACEGRFDLIDKPIRHAWLLVGPDGAYSSLLVARNPADGGFAYISPDSPGRGVFFNFAGREQVRAWADEVFPIVAEALGNASLPAPELFISDMEGQSDPASGMFRTESLAATEYWTDSSIGWFESVLKIQTLSQAQKDYQMSSLGTRLENWLDARSTGLDGEPLAPYDATVSVRHPSNTDWLQFGSTALTVSYREGIRYALYEPIKNALGTNVRCGEWGHTCTSKQYPARVLPGEYFQFWELGEFEFDVQIPINYAWWNFNADSSFDADWNSVLAWGRYMGNIPASIRSRSPLVSSAVMSPNFDFIASRINTDQAKMFAKANSKPLLPSISLDGWLKIGISANATPGHAGINALLGYILDTMSFGATEFWIFAPGWNDSTLNPVPPVIPQPATGNYRDQHEAFIRRANGVVRSWHPKRNRSYRNRRA